VKKITVAVSLVMGMLAGAYALEAKTPWAPGKMADKVVVYYFHGRARCSNCMKIEAYSKEAVEAGFADELKNGKVEWKVIDYEDKGNEHYFTDYKLFTKSVIVSGVKKGKETRWKNLQKVWQYLGDKQAFMAYVQAEVKACLKGAK
jgi:hypothetical protein